MRSSNWKKEPLRVSTADVAQLRAGLEGNLEDLMPLHRGLIGPAVTAGVHTQADGRQARSRLPLWRTDRPTSDSGGFLNAITRGFPRVLIWVPAGRGAHDAMDALVVGSKAGR